ncbi:ABC transporter ATP-binding protein [bacterium]|nr:ABC transporter ATP-binding protein [bacterium]
MIRADNLTKYYGPTKAIHNVTFRVEPGEILGFLGPNGAGKTTTIRILTGFIAPTFGTGSINGFDIFDQTIEARRQLGYLPENPPLYPELSVERYLHFHARIKGVPAKQRRERVNYVLDLFKIEDVRDKLIGKLSKGYRQRVGLAQALVHNPRVVFLDEPTVGLDPRQIIDTRDVIKSLAGEHTVMLSTHILPEVAMTCNRVAIINEGTIVAEDTPDQLTSKLKGSETIRLEVKGAESIEARLAALAGVTSVQRLSSSGDDNSTFQINTALGADVRAEVACCVVQNNLDLLELKPVKLSLEDIYLKLTTEEAEIGQ